MNISHFNKGDIMNAQLNAGAQTAPQDVQIIRSVITERNRFVTAREYMIRGIWCVVGFALLLAAFCGNLLLGMGSADSLPARITTRVSYRLHNPICWPAWLYYGALSSCLFLLIMFLFRKQVHPVADSNPKENPSAWICIILPACGLMILGEIAIRQAIACSW
ncbi:MAG: hypothetical protein PCFJNLEI_02387 [Verrucomicrobiae bacterium]|nr:hypothetical protein [Verrucomicrobiae bacterium]